MNRYSLGHLGDGDLLRRLQDLAARSRATTADLLAHIAEVDARRLYRPAAHPSMHSYCVHVLHLSECSAAKHIHAARAARKCPAIFSGVADGRLHLSAVVMLAAHLTPGTADDLLAGAAHKTRVELEAYLAGRRPRPEPPGRMQPAPAEAASQPAPGEAASSEQAPGPVEAPRTEAAPAPTERSTLSVLVRQSLRDKLRYAQELLGHRHRSGDPGEILERGLDAYIRKLEKRRLLVGRRPPPTRPSAPGSRYVPVAVRNAVWERDGGQCTFTSERGQRCPARRHLQFDHVEEVARGGEATVSNLRLLCPAHNQYAAERRFGAGFMDTKRRRAAEARERAAAEKAAVDEQERQIGPALRELGFRRDEARRGASLCVSIAGTSLEERLRLAIRSLAPVRGVSRVSPQP